MLRRKYAFSKLMLCAVVFVVALQSCKDDSHLLAPPAIANQSFVEEFDTMQHAYNRGWRWINRSTPLGNSNWRQAPGPASDMAAFSSQGNNTGAAFADYLSTSGTNNGVISNWLVSPEVNMQNGDKIVFYTKAQRDLLSGTDWGCRLQLRANLTNNTLDVGTGEDPGSFNELLVDVNPFEEENLVATPSVTAFPGGWTRFEATIQGMNQPTKGRFAFRYFLHGAGAAGSGNGVGIDSVAYIGKQ